MSGGGEPNSEHVLDFISYLSQTSTRKTCLHVQVGCQSVNIAHFYLVLASATSFFVNQWHYFVYIIVCAWAFPHVYIICAIERFQIDFVSSFDEVYWWPAI